MDRKNSKVMEDVLTVDMLIEQARVHNNHLCSGLPFCVSCRAAVLLGCNCDSKKAQETINRLPEGSRINY